MLSTNLVKLPWWNWMLEQFLLFSFFFFFCECLGIQFFNSLTCDLRDVMPRQRSLTLFFPANPLAPSLTLLLTITRFLDPFYTFSPSQSDSRLYHTQPFLPWVLRVWESTFYSQAFFTLHFLYLAKRRIFLGVIGILSMYLSLHT